MPDMKMCQNKECPLKNICYRFLAIPDKRGQDYFDSSPSGGEDCEHYLKLQEDDKLQPVEAEGE